jgi:hypothetical protein
MERFEADLLESVRQALRGEYASVHPVQPSLEPTRKRRRDAGPRVAINMMVPETVAAPFIKFCDDNRYTYWQGMEELMRRAKLI